MKKEARKLSLNRETLASMQSDDLANVHGGLAPVIISGALSLTRSSQICISAASASAASAIEATSQMVCKSRWCGPK